MSSAIEALYIYDELNIPILEHTYRGRPPPADALLSLFLSHPAPRPSLLYLTSATPPVSVFSITHSNLLFLVPSSTENEPLLVLEFLHRVIDVLEDFVGAPLLAAKIQSSYDVVAQLLIEMCDGGVVCNTEPNALRETVDVPGWMGKLLGGVGLPGASPALGPSNPLKSSLALSTTPNGANAPAIPWRRQSVRHTSNELYVDIVETLKVTIAPSGRPISALVNGTIVFTAKISGVPDLLLSLSAPGGQSNISHKVQLPVFHPCVRLARWRERPGELSFVPPDGRFVLAGYEVDLLPLDPEQDAPPNHMEKLFLPATVELQKSIGPNGMGFEVRLTLNTNFPGSPSSRGGGGGGGGSGNIPGHNSGSSTPSFLGVGANSATSASPTLEEVIVTVPISASVRNLTDIRASRGEATFMPGNDALEWRVPTTSKDAGSISGTATLRCTVVGPLSNSEEEEAEERVGGGGGGEDDENRPARTNPLLGYYNESYQTAREPITTMKTSTSTTTFAGLSSSSRNSTTKPPKKPSTASSLMPTSATVSFTVRGWLPSGIRVDALIVDTRKSRGLGEGVKPYKGVKYLCVSRKGVERRC
ncbi:hypothetical protein AJ80_03530 [Polytolypa hystricis UAMH7299]|uniref:MHD domain-containing protein n=1 Tax=Polytolypa hystricis (strain UAMH7299) TaxID=1447883 RepID=A0A2B7YI46_POLH7|nr:hypothetical protein AJ80_03530 [Polytolypa hystricis UAMH7299]